MDYSNFYKTPLGKRYIEGKLPIIAGYCTVPDRKRAIEIACQLNTIENIVAQRGGAYKPRTSPHEFQGWGKKGLEWLKEAYKESGLPIVTEIIDPRDVGVFTEVFGSNLGKYVIPQIGSRNMQNFPLLRELCKMRDDYAVTVLLKRGMWANIDEIIGAIQYLIYKILESGIKKVKQSLPILFCLRGIRDPNYRGLYRFCPDMKDIPIIKEELKKRGLFNVIVGFDPSHAAGNNIYVQEIARKAVKYGADFLLIETMLDSDSRTRLKCDPKQAITITQLKQLISKLQKIHSERVGIQ